ncbi:JmjC domain-containing protein [Kerstersia sp.]|uniref:JmjC domain-containing protein n=1 Tax=Kerstersia sp. TaxID=1930783 RepID=UPI003F908DDA
MNLNTPLTLLGGISPAEFMRDYWQRKPLLIRQAVPGIKPPVKIPGLRKLARQDEVESRLIWKEDGQWQMESGPFARLPKREEREWTLLVQSLDQHDDAAARLMQQFRFIPDARLDDVMVSVASDGGGVGPHFDSYDVFLLQAQGTRHWRIGQQRDLDLVPDLPLKILSNFQPDAEYYLEPGDMLYLPPQAAHDGIAVGHDCMTISIGFRSPDRATLARGMLEAAMDQVMERASCGGGTYAQPLLPGPDLSARYRDLGQAATETPAEIPAKLVQHALDSVAKVKFNEALATRFLGCWLSEPHPNAVFESSLEDSDDMADSLPDSLPDHGRLTLDRRTRMLYRERQCFINGECLDTPSDALLQALADTRELDCAAWRKKRVSMAVREYLADWLDAGWLHWRE